VASENEWQRRIFDNVTAKPYRFHTTWQLHASPDRVFGALVDIATYPDWWPDVRSVRKIDDDTAEIVCRSSLPYRLTLRMRRDLQDERSGTLRVNLSGDLAGWLTGQVTAAQDATRLDIIQLVDARKPLLRLLSPVARPLFRINHALMMHRGRDGLGTHLSAPAGPAS